MNNYILSAVLAAVIWILAFAAVGPVAAEDNAAESEVRLLSAEWLQRGLIDYMSVLSRTGSKKNASEEELVNAFGVFGFYHGFSAGLNCSVFQFPTESPPKSLFWPDEWDDLANTAPQILAFMQKHKERIRDNESALSVLYAWALAEHPESTAKDKILSGILLKESTSND